MRHALPELFKFDASTVSAWEIQNEEVNKIRGVATNQPLASSRRKSPLSYAPRSIRAGPDLKPSHTLTEALPAKELAAFVTIVGAPAGR